MIMQRIKNFSYIITVLFAILILILSIIPTDVNGEIPSFYFPGMDKLVHGLMYASFTVLVLNEYLKSGKFRIIAVLLLMGGVWLYSVLMEIVQLYFVSYRSGDWKDALANLVGILLGAVLIFSIRRIRS